MLQKLKQLIRKEKHILCVILRKPKGVKLSKDLVSRLWDKNKEGAGWLVKPEGKDEWFLKKGQMDKEKFLTDIEKYLGEGSELVAHMRIKTTGSISPEHTHPFCWTGKSKSPRYLFHNGTVKFLKPKDDSDSMLLAEILANLNTEEAHDRLRDFAAHGCGRFVTLTDGKITVFGDDESVEDEGIWFSNGRHLTTVTTNVVHHYQQQSHHHGYLGGGARKAVTQSSAPFRDEKVEMDPLVAAIREKSIKVIANFYALKKAVVCNQNFITNWAEENGAKSMSTPILEKVAEFCSENKSEDPFFEFFLALQSK